jgi:hypothetical protein
MYNEISNGIQKCFGTFKTEELARERYLKIRKEIVDATV